MLKREIILVICVYVTMLAGMAAKAVYDDLTGVHPFGLKNLLIPLIVSPMVYGAIYKVAMAGSKEMVLMLIFGFQNGFFWQDVFSKLGPTSSP